MSKVVCVDSIVDSFDFDVKLTASDVDFQSVRSVACCVSS